MNYLRQSSSGYCVVVCLLSSLGIGCLIKIAIMSWCQRCPRRFTSIRKTMVNEYVSIFPVFLAVQIHVQFQQLHSQLKGKKGLERTGLMTGENMTTNLKQVCVHSPILFAKRNGQLFSTQTERLTKKRKPKQSVTLYFMAHGCITSVRQATFSKNVIRGLECANVIRTSPGANKEIKE